jgi:hypothetical protein
MLRSMLTVHGGSLVTSVRRCILWRLSLSSWRVHGYGEVRGSRRRLSLRDLRDLVVPVLGIVELYVVSFRSRPPRSMMMVFECKANSVYAYKQNTKQRHPKARHASGQLQQKKGISK